MKIFRRSFLFAECLECSHFGTEVRVFEAETRRNLNTHGVKFKWPSTLKSFQTSAVSHFSALYYHFSIYFVQTNFKSSLASTICTPALCGSHFQKKCFIRSQGCRATPNQSVLESTDLIASNDAPNFESQLLGADVVSFEVARLPQNLKLINKKRDCRFKRDEIRPVGFRRLAHCWMRQGRNFQHTSN